MTCYLSRLQWLYRWKVTFFESRVQCIHYNWRRGAITIFLNSRDISNVHKGRWHAVAESTSKKASPSPSYDSLFSVNSYLTCYSIANIFELSWGKTTIRLGFLGGIPHQSNTLRRWSHRYFNISDAAELQSYHSEWSLKWGIVVSKQPRGNRV